ncbi:MAG: CTP synthetase [Candidatus Aenigmatarchaeota archaeon]|mgnify:CR=1 FL=1|nr:MAG: CTP synthetase [Candidatus Aenigmarchaeota archaeon]
MPSKENSGDSKPSFKSLAKKSEEHEFYNNIPKGYTKGGTKYIIVTGSVISGVGKGTFTSSLGNLLSLYHGFKVAPVKFDGYLNFDAGTLNPYRHGEVFVLDDGTECDLDLGSYERMLNKGLSKDNYLTAGKIFKTIIDKERAGKYLGRDVQFIPHVTGEIKNFLRNLSVKRDANIVIVEVGGTIGDIENAYFLEAMRELAHEEGKENVCFINVVYILEPGSLGEQKSKAAQLGLRTLMGLGVQPDIVVCRSERPLNRSVQEKISIYSNVPVKRVINSRDVGDIHAIPLFLKDVGVDQEVIEILGLKGRARACTKEFEKWEELVSKIKSDGKKKVKIGITGKYTAVHDSYISILKALEHTAPYLGASIDVRWIETTNTEKAAKEVEGLDGIIVPGGFGSRGSEGKIACIKYARENNVPFLGLCFGFQMAVLEYARNVAKLGCAASTEIDTDTKEPVICILPEQEEVAGLGGTMRLGGYDMMVKEGTLAHKLYGSTKIRERFRHRFNVNTKYIDKLEEAGMVFSGMAPQKRIMQILELPGHKFFFATQYHPEFTSRPLSPSPVFRGFLEACLEGK